MAKLEIIKNDTTGNSSLKLKDATTKFLALSRYLLLFYPGTRAKGGKK